MSFDTSRDAALAADAADPLADFRALFVTGDNDPIYLDGNSLGRPPRASAAALAAVVAEWSEDLIAGWEKRWLALPGAVGDEIAELVGALPGEIVVSDSTTVNLYKCALAALDARKPRRVVVTARRDFPSLRHVLAGIAVARDLEVRLVDSDPAEGLESAELADALDDAVALCCLSAVDYRSGALLDIAATSAACHGAGALFLLDASHAAGAVELDFAGAGVDLAVGCSYKYLNGGPGSPAWLYVPTRLRSALRSPIWGWFSAQDRFEMGPDYAPLPGADGFLPGTPSVLGLTAVRAGVAPLRAAGMRAVAAKSRALVSLLATLVDEQLAPLGAHLMSPRDPARRGGHLAISHPRAAAAVAELSARGLLVGDFRRDDLIRLAPVALSTRFVDVVDAAGYLETVLSAL